MHRRNASRGCRLLLEPFSTEPPESYPLLRGDGNPVPQARERGLFLRFLLRVRAVSKRL